MVSSITNFFAAPLSLAVQRALPQSSNDSIAASDHSKELVNVLLSGISKDSSNNPAGLSGQQDQLSQTLKQLSSSKDDLKAQRKEQARQKIQQLKAQIRALRLTSGDPKAAARQAANLARELASAVRDYSGGGLIGGSASSVFSAGAPAQGTAPTEAGVAASVEASTAAVPEGGVVSAEVQTEATQAGENAQEDAVDSKATASAAPQSGPSQDDIDFANEARKLLNDLKNIIKEAKQKLQGKNGSGSNIDIAEGEKALHETSALLGQIESGGFSAPVNAAVNILA